MAPARAAFRIVARVLAVVGSCVVATTRAAAADRPLALSWDAPATCASASEVERAVAARITTARGTLHVSVEIRAREGGFVADIATSDGAAGRTLEGASCAELTEAIVVILALAIDPNAQTEAAVPAPSTIVTVPSAPPPIAAIPAARVVTAPTPRRSIEVAAGAIVSDGVLPNVDVGSALEIAVLGARRSLRLGGTWWTPRSATIDGGAGGSFSYAAAAVRGCFAPFVSTVRFDACVGVEVGRFAASGRAVDHAREASAALVSAVGDGGLRVPIAGAFGLRASLGAGAVLEGRHPFVINGLGTVYRPASLDFRGGIAASVVF